MLTELNAQTDRFRAPRRAQLLDADALLTCTDVRSIDELWARLSDRLYPTPTSRVAISDYVRTCPDDAPRIISAADEAVARRVSLLGTGSIHLATPIDWHIDYKTGRSWPVAFMRSINYTNLGSPSDVKVPWEISRLQWLMPAGQAYLLTGDERYASAVRDVLDEWIGANPYAHGVNWACTMEVAMRILSWTWFFHVFCRSEAWSDGEFRSRFLRTLYLHGEFTNRYLERSDVNGNHFTADAAALVFAGHFFGAGQAPARWAANGWQYLCDELPRQVTPDGVDFEGSIPYHRLVLELFFLAARFREAVGLPVNDDYRARVIEMARFSQAYTRQDGTTPLLGDADDARALPFGGQAIGDHRYIAGLVGAHWNCPDLIDGFSGPLPEIVWSLGLKAAARLSYEGQGPAAARSKAFTDAGYFVMRNERDHVFVDAGAVGQAGRGGHGHNDCLSFEAVLDGVHLVSDCGAYLYTADAAERNCFRSTASHNTPQVDGEEINRFIRWDYLWTLHFDAQPQVREWEPGDTRDRLVASHAGYRRLDGNVEPTRTVTLCHDTHTLVVQDVIQGAGEHAVTIPIQLAPGVSARVQEDGTVLLEAGDRVFTVTAASADAWRVGIAQGRVSPSYGVVTPASKVIWQRTGSLPASLTVTIAPRAL